MKILLFVDNLYDGGAGRVASVLANAMSNNHDVVIVTKESDIKYRINTNVKTITLCDFTKLWFLKVVKRIINLKNIIDTEKPNVIYSLGYVSKYTTFAYILSKNKNVKIISSERSDPNSVPSSSLMKTIRNWCYDKADIIVCQTNQAADYFRKQISTKLIVIPNPITPNLPIWKGSNSNIIIAACRLDKQKNLPMLIDAFDLFHKEYPSYKLVIYGQGNLRTYLINYIKEKKLDDYISLPGSISNIHDTLAKSFMYVSSSDHEGMSNSMLEALAIGIPTVCTDCPIGGASMVIKDKINGILTPVKDSKRFYEAMKYVVDNKDKLSMMSEEAQKIRCELDYQKIAQQWINLM